MPYHDFICSDCDDLRPLERTTFKGSHCRRKGCKGTYVVSYSSGFGKPKGDAAVHTTERAVLYYSPKEGKYQYPGRNDQPVPERLVKRGYQRVEMTSLRDLQNHAKQTGAVSHVAEFDRGSGRSLDGD